MELVTECSAVSIAPPTTILGKSRASLLGILIVSQPPFSHSHQSTNCHVPVVIAASNRLHESFTIKLSSRGRPAATEEELRRNATANIQDGIVSSKC